MKNSLGTLAAVAAIAATATTTTVCADVQYATHLFDRVIPVQTGIDINNDGIEDYRLLNSNRLQGLYTSQFNQPNQFAADGGDIHDFAFGDVIDSSSTYTHFGYITIGYPGIAGFNFYIGDALHYAWLQFVVDGENLIILDGAWETTADTAITAIATVPEPAILTTGIAALAAAAALLRRRSKRNRA